MMIRVIVVLGIMVLTSCKIQEPLGSKTSKEYLHYRYMIGDKMLSEKEINIAQQEQLRTRRRYRASKVILYPFGMTMLLKVLESL